MAKTKKDIKKVVIFDFTEYYNNIKKQREVAKAEADAYRETHAIVAEQTITKPTFWQRIKKFFKFDRK